MINRIGNLEYLLKMTAAILAMSTPIICLLCYGYLNSISQYWNTEMQPLFIFSNVLTAYYFFSTSNWKLSSVLLILLTAFSIEWYPSLHNILAVSFFISNLIPLYKSKRFKYCMWIYLASIIILPFSLFFSEAIAICALCTFHIHSLNKMYRLTKVDL